MHTDDVESGVSGVSCCGSCPCALHLAAGSLISELSLLFFVWITPDRKRHTFFYMHIHTQYRPHHPTHTASHSWSCQTQNVICREQTTDVLQHKGCIVHQAGSLVVYIPGELLLAIIMSLVYYCTAKSLENCISLLYISLQVRKT